MATCLIGLGSNLGDRVGNLTAALAALSADASIAGLRHSSFWQTEPVGGPPNQGSYLNAAAVLETELPPPLLLARLQAVEDRLGRVRAEHWGPRTIDLDLLLYGDAVIEQPGLSVPHPRLAERQFVLAPAAEIAPALVHPGSNETIETLLAAITVNKAAAPSFRVFTDPAAMQREVRAQQRQGRRVGVVPTMGALHAGHLSLVEIARQHADLVVATIFVNPTQFGPQEDFAKYPRTLEADLAALSAAGCDYVLAPTPVTVYPPGYSTFVDPPGASAPLEGVCRPGHFRGVATIVLKLLGMVPADVACFGQKDYQQALVIRRMVADLNVPTRIVVCPIVREPDGLAMSSRNRYLSAAERQQALAISRSLVAAAALVAGGECEAGPICSRVRDMLAAAGIARIDYVSLADPDTLTELERIDGRAVLLIAAFVGSTRLIDNCMLEGRLIDKRVLNPSP
jgi:pantoate--beta-alanine ligase